MNSRSKNSGNNKRLNRRPERAGWMISSASRQNRSVPTWMAATRNTPCGVANGKPSITSTAHAPGQRGVPSGAARAISSKAANSTNASTSTGAAKISQSRGPNNAVRLTVNGSSVK